MFETDFEKIIDETCYRHCTFKFNNRFLKQVDGCTMVGPLSVTFSDIYMKKMENDVVNHLNLSFVADL